MNIADTRYRLFFFFLFLPCIKHRVCRTKKRGEKPAKWSLEIEKIINWERSTLLHALRLNCVRRMRYRICRLYIKYSFNCYWCLKREIIKMLFESMLWRVRNANYTSPNILLAMKCTRLLNFNCDIAMSMRPLPLLLFSFGRIKLVEMRVRIASDANVSRRFTDLYIQRDCT